MRALRDLQSEGHATRILDTPTLVCCLRYARRAGPGCSGLYGMGFEHGWGRIILLIIFRHYI